VIGEQALWQSVLMQALFDAITPAKTIKEKMERARAIAWFSDHNEDFVEVCAMANLPTDYVLKGTSRVIKQYMNTRRRRHVSKMGRKNKTTASGTTSIRPSSDQKLTPLFSKVEVG